MIAMWLIQFVKNDIALILISSRLHWMHAMQYISVMIVILTYLVCSIGRFTARLASLSDLWIGAIMHKQDK